jgi:hypothetical protein
MRSETRVFEILTRMRSRPSVDALVSMASFMI